MKVFTEKEVEDVHQLPKENSPRPDDITKEALQHLGPSAKRTQPKICNANSKNTIVP